MEDFRKPENVRKALNIGDHARLSELGRRGNEVRQKKRAAEEAIREEWREIDEMMKREKIAADDADPELNPAIQRRDDELPEDDTAWP